MPASRGVASPQEIHQLCAEGQLACSAIRLWEKLSSVSEAAGIPMLSRLLMRFFRGSIYTLTDSTTALPFQQATSIAKTNGER